MFRPNRVNVGVAMFSLVIGLVAGPVALRADGGATAGCCGHATTVNTSLMQRVRRRLRGKPKLFKVQRELQSRVGGPKVALQARSASGTTTATMTVQSGKRSRKITVTQTARRRTLNYESPRGKASLVLRLVKQTRTRRTYKVLRNTFSSQKALYREFQGVSLNLPSVFAGKIIKPRQTNRDLYLTNSNIVEDVDCKKQDGKCVCKCTHGFNPYGVLFCIGFLGACPGETNWGNQTCSGSADAPGCKN